MRIVGILLAAGQGSRFGADKRFVALGDGTPLALRSVRLLHAVLEEVVAVVRLEDHALAALLGAEGVRVERCAAAHEGMGASLAHAVRASAHADGWIVALADMPFVDTRTIAQVADALAHGAVIAAPSYRGTRGHPVGFARALGSSLAALGGDTGARDIVRAQAANVHLIEVDDPGVLADVDTPQQLRDPGGMKS